MPGTGTQSAQAAWTGWDLAFGGVWTGCARARAARPDLPVRAIAPCRAAPLRGLDHRGREHGWCSGAGSSRPGVFADRLHLLGTGSTPVIKRGWQGWTVHDSRGTHPTCRCAGSMPCRIRVGHGVGRRRAGAPGSPRTTRDDRAAGWLSTRKYPPGDWQVRRPWLEPADWVGRVRQRRLPRHRSDTAEGRVATPPHSPRDRFRGQSRHPRIGRGLRWITGMQAADVRWGASTPTTPPLVTSCRSGLRAVIGPRRSVT